MSTFKLPVEQVGLERSIQKAMDQFNRKPLKINVDDRSFTQPLGRITGAADEFTKSIEASNARVVAFGASVAVIESVKNAFSQLVVQTIKVEKALADINVVMGTSAKNLDQFGNSLFKIAKNTAQSFDSVASAATEFARQGLTMEQTLKRTNDALILTRLTGMKAADSVKGLTAAINAFGDAGLSTANIMNKLAAVDMAFAVSSEDLIDGLSRASAVAQDAGMNIDQLIGAITAAQQITARGGAVIGNSFKTIFTRIQRPQTIEQLEMLGVAVKDMQGNVIPAIKILENLAKTYDTLSQSQQSNIAQLVGGMFQINTLKAAMRDLGKENSITARAIQISASATDEAVKKNEQLNKTLDALLTKTGLSLQQLADQIGSITVGPGIEKILKAVNGLADGISNVLDGDSIGSNFANGFLKGIGNVISGPGAVLILGLVGKLFVDVAKFASTSIRNFMGMTSEAQKQKAVQESILNLLRSNHEVVGSLIGQGQTKRQQEQVILDLIVKQTAAQREQVKLAQHLARTAVNIGANENLIIPERAARRSASGYIPNFNAKQRERNGAIAGGYAPGKVKSMEMPSGQTVIYNTAEKVKKVPGFQDPFINPPSASDAGKSHRQKTLDLYGFDPYASRGFVPNFAKLTMKTYMKQPGATLQGLEDKIARNEISAAGAINMPDDIRMAAMRGKQRKDKSSEASKQARREADEARRMKIDGTGYATLIPQINRPAAPEATRVGTFKSGSATYPYSLSNLYVAGPKSPSTGATTNPEENDLENSVSRNIFKSSAQFSNAIRPSGTQGVNSSTIKKKLESTPGGKGAVGAAIGAAFEAAVAQAYGIDSAKSAERGKGDFDVNLSNTSKSPGTLNKVRNLFGIPSTISRMDFKASAEKGTFDSMAKKIFNDNRQKYLAQIGQTAASGFIPSFAKDHPLIEAIQREQAAGLPVSKIRINQSNKLKSSSNPMGLAVTNTRDEPRGMQDVPNFAARSRKLPGFDSSVFRDLKVLGGAMKEMSKTGVKLNSDMQSFVKTYNTHALNQTGLNKETLLLRLKEKGASEGQTKEALRQLGFEKQETAEGIKQINAARKKSDQEKLVNKSGKLGLGEEGVIGSRLRGLRDSKSKGAKALRSFGRFSGGFGASFGLPIAGGIIDQGLTSAFGGDRVKMSKGQRFASGAAGSITTGLSSGAMLGGAIGSAVPVIGTAVGAAVGGALGAAGGLVSALGNTELSMEELAGVVQEASSIQTELNNTFGALDQLKSSGLSESELAKKIGETLNKSNPNLKNQKGQTLAQAYLGANNEQERAAVRENFAQITQKQVSSAQLLENLGLFREAADNANPFIGKSKGVGERERSKLASSFGQFGLTEDQIGSLSNLKKDRYMTGRSLGGRPMFKSAAEGEKRSGENVAKILGFDKQKDEVNFNLIADEIDNIIDEGGWDSFLKAVQESGKNLKDVLEGSAKVAKEMKNAARDFSSLKDNIRQAAVKSKIAFEFLKGDLKIKNELDELKLKYMTMNSSVSDRLAMEENMLKAQAGVNAELEKSESLEETRQKLLGEVLNQLKSEGVTPTGLSEFSEKIQNASAETIKTLLDSPEKLEEALGIKPGTLAQGRQLSESIKTVLDGYKESESLINAKLSIENKQITTQMRIQELQEKEANSRQQLNLAVDEKIRSLRSIQIDEGLGFDSEIRAIERERKYQPFTKTGDGAQELFDIETESKLLAKRREKFSAESIKETQIQGSQLFKDTSVQDALINSNDKLIIAIDELRATLVEQANADVFAAAAEQEKLKSGGSSLSKELEERQARISSIQEQLKANASVPLVKDEVAQRQIPQVDFIKAFGFGGNRFAQQNPLMSAISQNQKNFSQPGDLNLAFADWNNQQKSTSKNQGSLKTADEIEKSNKALESELSSLTKETAELQNKIGLINRNKGLLSPGPTNTLQESQDKVKNFNLNKIFNDAQSQFSNVKDPTKFNESMKNEMLKVITKDAGFQEALGKRKDLQGAKIEDQIKALSQDGSFSKISEASNTILNSFAQLDNNVRKTSAGFDEDAKDLAAHSEQIKAQFDPLRKMADETEKASYSIRKLKESGDISGAARASLDLQRKYNVSSPAQQMAMREGMAQQGMGPMSNRDVFLAGVASNSNTVRNSELEFYRTLGEDLPRTFSGNMAKALTEAGAGIKSWDDALQDVALGFLDTLNQAIQQKLSNQILGLLNTGIGSMTGGFTPFSKGGVVRRSDGGEVYGGSGTKDDVPAMLNSGEYVIRKSAVNKYGKDFLTSINSGTVKQRNQGGMVGPADPNRELEEQTGEGGFLISSFGQAGTMEAGAITGRDNLMSFATQAGTSGERDVIQSTGAVDDYGQAMPSSSGGGVNIQLEDESAKLSGLGLISGPVADEVMTAKQQALDAVGAYDRNVEALRKYREQRKKAIKNAIKQALIGAAISFGMQQLQSAVQSTQLSKASNTAAIKTEATNLAAQAQGAGADISGIPPDVVQSYSSQAASNLGFSKGDYYMKSGSFDMAKANSRFAMNGVSNPGAYIAMTGGSGAGNTRGSTSFTKNFFSRSGNAANAAFAGSGFSVNSYGAVGQRTGFFGGAQPSNIGQSIGGSNTVGSMLGMQNTSWTNAGGTAMLGNAVAPNAPMSTATTAGSTGTVNYQQQRALRRAVGGKITKQSGESGERVPALLTGGEFVINKDAVKKHGLSFFNSINAQRLNRGGVVGKNVSMPAGSNMDSQSELLQQILDTLIIQGETAESTRSETQTLKETIESKTTNNITTGEAGETGTDQSTILQSILEEIKNQNTTISQEISNSVQNVIDKSQTSQSTEINNSSSSNSNSVRSSSNVSNVSNNSNFVDQTSIQNDLLSQILLALQSQPSGGGGGFSTSSGGSGGGVGDISINVTVDSKGGSQSSYEGGGSSDMGSANGVNSSVNQKANDIAKQIEESVIKILTDQQRLGGVLPNPSKK
jgi:TP901 family phage tail tape measure protein